MIQDRSRAGLFMIAGAAIAWSTTGFFTRYINADVWTQLAWRGLVGAAVIAAWMLYTDGVRAFAAFRQMRGAAWTYALASTFAMFAFIAAFKYASVADVMIVYATSPFLTAAAAWFWFRERTTLATIGAALCALAGVAIMIAGAGTGSNLLGVFLGFCMTAAAALMILISRRHRAIPMMAAACLSSFLSGVISLPLATPFSLSGQEMLAAALFGVIGMGIALPLYSEGARLAPASKAALVSALETPLAPLWVWMAFNEVPRTETIIGGIVVLLAVIGNVLWDAAQPASVDEHQIGTQ